MGILNLSKYQVYLFIKYILYKYIIDFNPIFFYISEICKTLYFHIC